MSLLADFKKFSPMFQYVLFYMILQRHRWQILRSFTDVSARFIVHDTVRWTLADFKKFSPMFQHVLLYMIL